MRLKRARIRFLIIVVLSVALGVSFRGFIYEPQCERLMDMKNEISSLRQNLAKIESFRQKHPDTAAEMQELAKRIEFLKKLLPENLSAGAFLLKIDSYAKAADITLSGFTSGAPEIVDGIARERIRLTVKGDYFALLDFVYALEQGGRFVILNAVRGTAGDDGIFTGTIDISIFANKI